MTNQTYELIDEDKFEASIQPFINVSSQIIVDEINVNDLSTFDHPIACINVINSLETDPLLNLRNIVNNLKNSSHFASEIVSKELLHVTLFIRYRCFIGTPRNLEFDDTFAQLKAAFPEMLFHEIFIDTMVSENGNMDQSDLTEFNEFCKTFSHDILPNFIQKFLAEGMVKVLNPWY